MSGIICLFFMILHLGGVLEKLEWWVIVSYIVCCLFDILLILSMGDRRK